MTDRFRCVTESAQQLNLWKMSQPKDQNDGRIRLVELIRESRGDGDERLQVFVIHEAENNKKITLLKSHENCLKKSYLTTKQRYIDNIFTALVQRLIAQH